MVEEVNIRVKKKKSSGITKAKMKLVVVRVEDKRQGKKEADTEWDLV